MPRTRLLFGGDVMLGRIVGQLAAKASDPAAPFRDIAPLLASAGITFVNLESPFSDGPPIADAHMIFRAAPEMVLGLKLAGVDVVSTANNHARDCGSHGIEYTLSLLDDAGIAAAGTGRDAAAAHAGTVLERNGVRFGFLAYTYNQSNGNHRDLDERIAMLDPVRAADDVTVMKARADVVIVSMHAGGEYQSKPNAEQAKFARAVIQAGAKVVVGHHPHVVQPVKQTGDSVVFYSLGNLVFDQFQRPETQLGAVARVEFLGPKLEWYELISVRIQPTGPRVVTSAPQKTAASDS